MKEGVLIHLPDNPATRDRLYFHCELALAEGFRALGIPVFGNYAYWKESPSSEWTLPPAPVDFSADLHVRSFHDLLESADWRRHFRASGIHVVLDSNDGPGSWLAGPDAAVPDLILRTHFHRDLGYAPNVRPWAFGLTNRLINAFDHLAGEPMQPTVASNSRCNHHVRQLINHRLIPALSSRYSPDTTTYAENADYGWLHQQTHGRHSPRYFQALNRSLFTNAFGGNFLVRGPLGRDPLSRIKRTGRHWLLQLHYRVRGSMDYNTWCDFVTEHSQHFNVVQTDNWRWWESLLSRSVPLHLDAADHGWKLPEMPVNGQHYLGLRGWDFPTYVDQLLSISEPDLAAIAQKGCRWALTHYGPKPSAQRLLNWVGESIT